MTQRRRAFRIWFDRNTLAWRWECSLCWPPVRGCRFGGQDAWARVVRISLPYHMRCRSQHHEWVRRNAA